MSDEAQISPRVPRWVPCNWSDIQKGDRIRASVEYTATRHFDIAAARTHTYERWTP